MLGRVLAAFGLVGVVACSGGSGDVPSPTDPAAPPPSPTTTPGSSSGDPAAPPIELAAPTAVDKTVEGVPGTTVIASLEAKGATDTTSEIVTPPAKGFVNWIDAKKGELVYRPKAVDAAVGDELTYVVKGNGKTSAPAKLTITQKALDFTTGLTVVAPKERWYSYNLAANFNNAGSSDCGASQPLTITSGKLLERAWPCGTYPELSVTIGAARISGGTSTAGGSFRRVTIARKQFDAPLQYVEESTDCTSYNSTLNSCNAGMSASTTGTVHLGAAPTTKTAPVFLPTTCETKGEEICYGLFAATDADGDLLDFEMTEPANGQAAPVGDIKGYAYKAKPGFVGTDSFTATVTDGVNKSAPVTISIVVK